MSWGKPKLHGVRAFGPRTDAADLDDHEGPVLLEQLRGDAWIEVGRYETSQRAASALDELISEGVHSSRLRLSPLTAPKRHRRWRFWEK